jgi:exopolyphosphatase/guanosine-5'-triphosphate,3'-diphosphate pyrophosphatase
MAAAVARYHRGALPRAGQKTLAGFNPAQRATVVRLAGILRLANAMDAERNGRIRRIRVHSGEGALLVWAEGYSPRDRLAEDIAAGRHLLETVYRRPILIKALRVTPAQPRPHLVAHKLNRTPA